MATGLAEGTSTATGIGRSLISESISVTRISNAQRIFRNILYRIRHRHGFKAVLRKRDTSPTFDPETGRETSEDNDYILRKVAELPRREERDFEYDLSYIAAGKNFTYGALFDRHDKVVIVDRTILRNANDDGYYVIANRDQMVIEGDIYEIATIIRLKGNLGYILGLVHINSDKVTL